MKEVNVAFFMVSHLLNLGSSSGNSVGIHHEQQASSIGLCTLSFSLFYAEEQAQCLKIAEKSHFEDVGQNVLPDRQVNLN